MRRLLVVLCVVFAVNSVFAARFFTQVFDDDIKTLQVLPNGEQLSLPVIDFGSADEIVVSFDELSY